MESISGVYTGVWLAVVFVLMAMGIVNTQLMAVFERTREFGLLQALGMRPRQVVAQVLIESALLIGLGVCVGVAAMLLTLIPFGSGIDLGPFSAAAEMGGAGGRLYPRLDPLDALYLSLIVWTLGIVATLWPACKAAATDPAGAMGAV